MLSTRLVVIALFVGLIIAITGFYFIDIGEDQPLLSSELGVSESEQQKNLLELLGGIEQKLSSVNDNLSGLQYQLEELDQRITVIEGSPATSLVDVEPTDNRQRAEPQLSSRDRTKSQQDRQFLAEQRKQALIERFESDFIAEPVDEVWGATARVNVDNIFSNTDEQVYQGSQLENIECRASTCRVQISHGDGIAAENFEDEFMSDAAKAGFPRVKGYSDDSTGVNLNTYYLIEDSATAQQNQR